MSRCLVILALFATLLARAESVAEKLTVAGVAEFIAAYQTWDASRFAAAANLFRQATTNAPTEPVNFYWLGAAEFHRMLQLRGNPTNSAAAESAMDAAIAALTAAVKLDATSAECHALLGTLYGMKCSGSIVRAAWFGPRVAKHRTAAMKSGAANPRVQYLLGTCQFHTARKATAFKEALATLLAAEKLFQTEAKTATASVSPRWGHDSCLTFIGCAYEKLGQRVEAAEYFRKALNMHPQDHVAQAGLKRVAGTR